MWVFSRQKHPSRAMGPVELIRLPAELLSVLGLESHQIPSSSQYSVTSKSCQVSNGGIGRLGEHVAKQHGSYILYTLLRKHT